ncbi:helix-turn-helix domain-containing protein, partial [Bacillus sp. MHSD17]|nr:helix-turn-helix domain-containing protein [Bacillus sp. MHSD17]
LLGSQNDMATIRLAKAIRITTLNAICKALECQPGDILEYQTEDTE